MIDMARLDHCFGDITRTHDWQPFGLTIDGQCCGGLVPTDICDTCGVIRQHHPGRAPFVTTLAFKDEQASPRREDGGRG